MSTDCIPLYYPPELTGLIQTTGRRAMDSSGFADVLRGTFNDQSVAIKVFRYYDESRRANARRRFERECGIWSVLGNPNIVPLLGYATDIGEHGLPSLVSPWYSHGDVANYLKTNQNENRMQLIKDIALGIEYLHRKSIIHGNLKASNVLIDDNGNACITDFGFSKILDTSSLANPPYTTRYQLLEPFADIAPDPICRPFTDNICDAPDDSEYNINPSTTAGWRWKAVELMRAPSAKHAFALVTQKADIWSFAMTVCEIFSGAVPFSHIRSDPAVILFVARNGGRPLQIHYPRISEDVWNVLEQCWDAEPDRRPAASELCRFYASKAPLLARM